MVKYRLENDPPKGRSAVATELITAGTQLLVTSAYACVSLSACNWCFAAPTSLSRCGGCRQVRYCSRKCQQSDWTGGSHGRECASWKSIPRGAASQTVLLVARLAAKLFLIADAPEEDGKLLELRHHFDDHTLSKLQEFEEMAQLVLLILVRSKFNVAKLDYEQLQVKYEREIVLLFCRVNCNAFTICDDVNTPTGVGMFPAAAMLNHSCAPNCVVSFAAPQQLKIQVIRHVQENEELTISYVELLESTQKRRRVLRASYFFQCECVRCQDSLRDPADDWLLDGFVCENEACKDGSDALVLLRDDIADDRAFCQACGQTTDAGRIRNGLARMTALEQQAGATTTLAEAWQIRQEMWLTMECQVKCHPRSTLYANAARSMANFLIDHGKELQVLPASSVLLPVGVAQATLEFLERERDATSWILPHYALPSRGLLFFQLAKLSAQCQRHDDAKSYIRQALAVYGYQICVDDHLLTR